MNAMILAAGLGTRLRPLTFERAKPAIPLLDKPLVVRLMEKLMQEGVTAFRLNLHHLPRSIEKVFESDTRPGFPVSFSYEPEILGTAGGLKANDAFFDQGTFVMANGDIVADLSLREAIAFHRERDALATLLLYPQAPPYRHAPIRIDDDGRLRRFKGNWPGGPLRDETYVFTGIHILEPDIFGFIPSGRFCEINDQVYPDALRRGRTVLGFPVSGYWNDLGDPSRYLEAQKDLFVRVKCNCQVHIAPGAQLASSSGLGPFVTAGSGFVTGPDSWAENAIFWDDVRLGSGSRVTNSIVGSGVSIEGEHSNKIITRNGEAPIA
jgi:NDP-sugar pyrophosphorylase family protein